MDLSRLSRDQIETFSSGQYFMAGKSKYILMGKLGNGAVGIVRKAKNIETGKQVVVKFLAPDPKYIDINSMDEIYRRFKHEGEKGKELYHDNIVEVLAFEENIAGTNFIEDDELIIKPMNPFIVMEHAGNRTLEGYIKKRKEDYSPKTICVNEETVHIAYEISKALVYLHRRGHVHRDVKPANIFLTKNSNPLVTLGDFGIIKWSDLNKDLSTGNLTTTGQKGLGTLKYMPPEQSLNPKDVSVKSDIYSFGITLFELFTNQILHDIHHVFQIREVRLDRSSFERKMYQLGLGFMPDGLRGYEYLFNAILDTSLKVSGRPTSTKFEGMLKRILNEIRQN